MSFRILHLFTRVIVPEDSLLIKVERLPTVKASDLVQDHWEVQLGVTTDVVSKCLLLCHTLPRPDVRKWKAVKLENMLLQNIRKF